MPLDFGASRHGSDMGPSAIRLAGLRESLSQLGLFPEFHYSPMNLPSELYEELGSPKEKYLKPIATACLQLAKPVEEAMLSGAFPLVLGGDHSIALGTISGVSEACRKQNKKLGVLYVDAHGDFNTPETSLTGNIHGMGMAALCGYGNHELVNLYTNNKKVDSQNVCYLGVRDLDPGERDLMKSAGVKVYSVVDIDRLGFSVAVRQAIEYLAKRVDVVHISFDIDVMDPSFAPGVGIQVPGGLSYREVLLLMEEVSAASFVCSAEIVEVNPVLDVCNKTAKMAVEIISRLFGYTVF